MKKVTAIIGSGMLEAVEIALRHAKAPGISVSAVKGYGEYANFFSHDWMVRHTKIEIFIGDEQADAVVQAIVASAQTGGAGDGIVAVQPADKVLRIRDSQTMSSPAVAVDQVQPILRSDPPARAQHVETVRNGLSALTVAVLIVAAFVSVQHRLHFLAAGVIGLLVLYAVVGLWNFARKSA